MSRIKKYTPGPWRAIAGDIQALDMDEEWTLTIATGIDQENTSLITAAPDLYEALEALVHEFEAYDHVNEPDSKTEMMRIKLILKAHDALAKARR